MLRKFKRGKIYYIRGTVKGKYVYESTGCRRGEDAEDCLIRREAEIRQGGSDNKITFPEAASIYMKAGKEVRFLAPLIRHFKDYNCNDITLADVIEAANTIYPTSCNATKNRQAIGPVSAVINNASKSKLCNLVRFEKLPVEEIERPHATPEYLNKFISHAPENLGALVLFMAKTGTRIGNAADLTWEEIHFKEKYALLPKTKNKKPFRVYLPQEIIIVLANLPKADEKVFGFSCHQTLYKAMKRTAKKAGLPYLTPHEIGRHTFATWYMMYVEPNIKKLMIAGNWKSVQSVLKYIHVVPDEAKTAVEKMPQIGAKSVQSSGK